VQAETPKPPQCHAGQEPGWEATAETVRRERVKVSDEKTNVCEPLLTHRKIKDDAETGAGAGPGTKARALVRVPRAGELPVCGPGGVRCIGGVSSSQRWQGRGEPVASMLGTSRSCLVA